VIRSAGTRDTASAATAPGSSSGGSAGGNVCAALEPASNAANTTDGNERRPNLIQLPAYSYQLSAFSLQMPADS
jgi:hypothetical protein